MRFRHFAIALLSVMQLSQGAWQISTVDSTAGSGFGCSLVLSASGTPHMAYYRPNLPSFPNFFEVYYARPSGSSYLREVVYDNGTMTPGISTSIVLAELGTPAISYTRSSTINYKIRTGGSWSSEVTVPGNGGPYSSMLWEGTEAAPTPLIAYQDATLGYLKTALFNGATFNAATQDNSGSAGAYASMAESGSYTGIAYIKAGKLGYYEKTTSGGQTFTADSANAFMPFSAGFPASACALAVAPSQTSGDPMDIRPHVILFNGTGYYYTTTDINSAVWMAPELIETVGAQLQTFQGCSIQVGSDGVVRVAYFDFANRQLRYAERKNGIWTTELVSSAIGGANCVLRLDSKNLPHIAYTRLLFDGANYNPDGLAYAVVANGSSSTPSSLPASLTIQGKSKRTITTSSITIKGSATNAVSIQWRVGKKGGFLSKGVSGGAWKIKVKKLKPGQNIVEFRAVNGAGSPGASKKLKILVQ